MATTSPLPPVNVPILVGVTGKRKVRLDELGVTEDLVRLKLRRAFALLQELAPNSPKLLLCGMADGVDEIAAKLVIEAVEDGNPGQRQFRNWSIVGLLPMPEEAFVDDFAPGEWWYHALDDEQRKLIRKMKLQTLAKAAPCAAEPSFTAADLRRPQDGSNPARTAHYEQLGMVLAERSTVLIAVMPEGEVPDRPGGTAQVVAHRLNGWRAGWPPAASRDIAGRSSELVVPAALATPVAGEVWLIPIGSPKGEADPVDLRVLRPRPEFEEAPAPRRAGLVARCRRFLWRPGARMLSRWRAGRDVLIRRGRPRLAAARTSCRLLRPLDAFNRRAADTKPRDPPEWDGTINAHPGEPAQWSPLAATERLRGTFSDIQGKRKEWVVDTATWLALIAGVSIFLLELYAELFETDWGRVLQALPFHDYLALALTAVLHTIPIAYVVLVAVAIVLYRKADRRAWPAIAEDYRLVAEALRVQLNWWRIGLAGRRDRVDNVILRYDTGAFQLLRRGLGTVLDAISFAHAEIPRATPDLLPELVRQWIDREERPPGQIQYHRNTARRRKLRYGEAEFAAWSLFGISLGAAVWLAAYTAVRLAAHEFPEVAAVVATLRLWFTQGWWPWLVSALAAVAGILLLALLGKEDLRSPELAFKAPHIVGSWAVGMLLGGALAAVWAILHFPPDGLRKVLFLASVIFLAWGGIIRYRTEKIAIEAEAQGSETALPIYRRAKAALDAIEQQHLDPDSARRQREKIIRDLGEFALNETEAWLRSHRERPLHPALG
jgi:hypothetical protein